MTAATSTRLSARIVIVTALAGLAVAMGGCDGDSASAQALRQANEKLVALTPDGGNTPSLAFRGKVYNEIVTLLRPVADRGTAGQNASANLLISHAQAGIAEVPAADAASLERSSLNQIQGVRDLLGQYLSLSALSEAAGKYDPTPELTEIEKQIKDKDDQRVAEAQRKAAIDAQVADIRSQSKAKSDASRGKRQEAGALKSSVTTQTATQAETTLRQAAEISRQADALDVEASTLDARAAQISPQSTEIQLQLDRLAAQKSLLEKARADVQKRSQTAKANATEAAASAAAAAASLKKALASLDEMRSGDLAKATDQAMTAYQAAAAAAKKAAAEARGAAQMALGNAQQALGDLAWNKAHGLASYADLLESIATATPALSDAAAVKTKAEATRTAAKTALDEATAAYQEADRAYQAGGTGSPEIKARVERVNTRLAAIVKATSGGSVDIKLPSEQGEPPAAPAEGGTPAAAIDPASPNATMQALADISKTGNFAAAADLFYTSSEQEKSLLVAVFGLAPKMKQLQDACQAKFGKGLDAAVGAQGPDLGGFKDLKPADLQFKIEGDSAEAPLPTGQSIKLKQKDGKWLVDGASMGMNMQALGMAAAMAPALSKAVDEVTADIESGKLTSAEAAMAAFQQKAAAAMGLSPKPGGG